MPDPFPDIRLATFADVPGMAALDAELALKPWSEANLARYCKHNGYHALVCGQAEALFGFIIYSRLVDEVSIDNVVVSSARQGQGLGGALLQLAMSEMSAAGLTRCLLDVRESNVAARSLYKNNGFTVDGVRARYYATQEGREDALLMSRRL